jgi:hypothetical protein
MAWSPSIRDGRRPRVFQKRMLRRIFEQKMDEVLRGWRNYIMRRFITCNLLQI